MGRGHDPFAADKGSTADVRVVPRGVSIGDLKRHLDETTTYFTPKPCRASAEMVCVALDSESSPLSHCYFKYKAFFFQVEDTSFTCHFQLFGRASWPPITRPDSASSSRASLRGLPEIAPNHTKKGA